MFLAIIAMAYGDYSSVCLTRFMGRLETLQGFCLEANLLGFGEARMNGT